MSSTPNPPPAQELAGIHGWCTKCGAAWPTDPKHPAHIAATKCACGAKGSSRAGAPEMVESRFSPSSYGDPEPDWKEDTYEGPQTVWQWKCGACGRINTTRNGAVRCCAIPPSISERVADAVRLLRASGYVIIRRKAK